MLCSCCGLDKNKSYFSNAQRKKKKDIRKCSNCCNSENGFTLEKQDKLFKILIEWLLENGSEFPHLKIEHINENFRGIVSNKNIKKNKVILKVPEKCIITYTKAKNSEVGKELEKSGYENYSSHTVIALYILQEKLNPNSFWKPYLDILPPNYADFPQFYMKNEIDHLENSFIVDMIKSRNLSLEKEFRNLVKALCVFGKKITLRDYIWARIAVVSRVFQINLSKEKKDQGLVPMADMLNHSIEPGTKWSYVPDEDSFVIVSDKLLFNNKEVFDTYGPKCNSRYLVNYGFTLPDNHQNNQAVIFIKPSDLTKSELKLKLIGDNFTSIDDSYCEYKFLINEGKETRVSQDKNFRFQFMKLLDREVSKPSGTFTGLHCTWSLFGFLRFILSEEEELFEFYNKIKEGSTDLLELFIEFKPKNYKTELKILKVLAEYCEKVLDGFSTLMEEDIEELKKTEPYTNRWNILNMLIGEKNTLLFYRELGVFVCKLWNEHKSIHKIGRFLRKHETYSSYYKAYWSKLL